MTKRDIAPKLREGGFRLTPQRAIIMDAIATARGHAHLTAQQVFLRARNRLPGLNLATVYRTLDTLHEAGLVDQMISGVGETRFSVRDPRTRHGHLVCRRCESVLEIDLDAVSSLVKHIQETHDFTLEVEHLTLSGICRNCRKDKSPNRAGKSS